MAYPTGIRQSQGEMRFAKLAGFWRGGRSRRSVRVPKLKSKLVKLEREIGGVADRIARDRAARRAARKPKNRIATFSRHVGRSLMAAIGYGWHQIVTTVSSARRVVTIGVRAAPAAQRPKTTTPEKSVVASNRTRMESTNRSGLVLVSICFGLVAMSGVIIALLFLQIKDMKGEIARWQQNLSATQSQLRQVEKAARQKAESAVKKAADARPQRAPIVLSNDEMKVIRASIKVLPPKPGAQAKIRVGEEMPDLRSAPVPESLAIQIPKLRGARFSIDDNGAIALFAEGNNYVGAVIEPQ
jgi:hypothetical protein